MCYLDVRDDAADHVRVRRAYHGENDEGSLWGNVHPWDVVNDSGEARAQERSHRADHPEGDRGGASDLPAGRPLKLARGVAPGPERRVATAYAAGDCLGHMTCRAVIGRLRSDD